MKTLHKTNYDFKAYNYYDKSFTNNQPCGCRDFCNFPPKQNNCSGHRCHQSPIFTPPLGFDNCQPHNNPNHCPCKPLEPNCITQNDFKYFLIGYLIGSLE